jgi:ANTAR domain
MTPEEAFQLLSRVSQNINRKVREISADLVQGRIDREMFRPVQGE